MQEDQWRKEYVALDAPATMQTTSNPSANLPPRRKIPWKWLIVILLFIGSLGFGLTSLKNYKNGQDNAALNNSDVSNVKTQEVNIGNLAGVSTSLQVDSSDKVVINGRLQISQGIVITPIAQPSVAILGQIYIDKQDNSIKYYNGQQYVKLATTGDINSVSSGLSETQIVNLITNNSVSSLPQPLGTTDSPTFNSLNLSGSVKLSGSTSGSVTLQAAAATNTITFTLPSADGTANQCLSTNGSGALSFIACASGSGSSFVQGGNAFGAQAVLGTTDNNSLAFITNGTTQATLDTSGNLTFGAASTISTTSGNLTLQSTAAGSTVALQAGTGGTVSVGSNGVAGTIQIGNTSGAVAQTVNLGNNTTASSTTTATLGSTIGTSTTNIQGGTGGVIVKTGSTGSATGFQVQNAAGAELFNINSATTTIRINGSNTAELQTWAATTATYASSRRAQATVTAGGYIYNIGGISGSAITSTVEYGKIGANGDVSAWTTTTPIQTLDAGSDPVTYTAVPRAYSTAVAFGGYLYLVGGYDSTSTVSASVLYVRINADGSLGSYWQESTNKLYNNVGIGGASTVVLNGYLYLIGGGTGVSAALGTGGVPNAVLTSNTVQYARINADGTLGAFSVASNGLTEGRIGGRAIIANGYMYYVGGQNSSLTARAPTYYVQPASSGNITSAWSTGSSLNNARAYHGVAVQNGYLYAYGGGATAITASASGTVESADFGSSGAIGAWSASATNMSVSSANFGYTSLNGYIYAIGGNNSSGSGLTSSQFTTGSRIYASSLDLVGLSGDSLTSGGVAGSLNAGNTTIAGSLLVSDSATFLHNISVVGNLQVGGQVAFRNDADSTKAFQIQNAAGATVLNVDTENAFIRPGYAAGAISTTLTTTVISYGTDDISSQALSMAMGVDGKPMIATYDSTQGKPLTIKCLNSACSSTTVNTLHTNTPSPTDVWGIHTSVAINKSTGFPVIGVRNTTSSRLNVIRCNASDCSGDNLYLPSGITSSGSGVFAMISYTGIPLFFYSQGSTNDLAVQSCLTSDCSSLNATESKLSDGNNTGNHPTAVIGSDNNPIIAHQDQSGTNSVDVTHCATSSCSGNFSGATTTTITYGATDIGDNIAIAMPQDGLPVIMTDTTGGAILLYKCATSTCSSITGPTTVVASGASASGMSMTVGSDDLPIISYKATSVAATQIVHCGNALCSSGNTLSSISGSGTGFGSQSSILIGYDEVPVISHVTSGVNAGVTHCVDVTCSLSTADLPTGGVTLGGESLSFAGLYVDTINSSKEGAKLRLTSDGTFYSNSLKTNTDGIVSVLSSSATAFLVQNPNVGTTQLSVDSSASSVNIGTTTSISSYGLNSSVATILRNTTNSTSQFAVQNASSASLLNVDSSNNRINLFNSFSALSAPSSPAAAVPAQNATPTVTPTGTTGSTTYNYIIEAVTTIGNSAPSTAGTTSTGNATLSSTNYNAVSWSAFVPASGSTTYYKIYRTVGGATTGLIGTTTSTSFNDTGYVANGISVTAGGNLTASTAYFYKITTIDSAGGESTASSEVTATTGVSTKAIALTWTAVANATGYKIYRSTTTNSEVYLTTVSGGPFTDNGSITIGSGSPPSTGTAYSSTNNANSLLQLSVGGNGTPAGQVYVSGNLPSSAIGTVTTDSIPTQAVVQGRYVYVINFTSGTLQAIDVSIPERPRVISSVSTGTSSNPNTLAVAGRYAYVTDQALHKMLIFDISNPSAMSLTSTISVGTTPRGFDLQGRYAYVSSTTSNTLQIYDVSNPASPKPVSVTSTGSGSSPIGLSARGNYVYVANTGTATLQVYDVTDPKSPVAKGSVATGTTPYRMALSDRYLYLSNFGSSNIQVIDIANLGSPVTVSTFTVGVSPRHITLQGRYLYVANSGSNNAQIVDVSNPTSLRSVGTVATNTTPYTVAVSGRYGYVPNFSSNTLQVFDFGGAYIQQLEVGGAEFGTVQVNGKSTFSSDASFQGGVTVGGALQVSADLGVAGNSWVQGDLRANNLTIGGSVLGGLTITNISTPATPTVTTVGTTGTQTWGYKVVAVGANGSTTPASTEGTTATGNATSTLSTSAYQRITWVAVNGAVSYKIYRTTVAVTSPNPSTTGLIGTTSALMFDDTGIAGDASAAPTADTTDSLTVTGKALFKPASDTATAFQIQNAAGTTTLFAIDTTGNGTVSIQAAASGAINIGTVNSLTTTIGKSGGTSQLTVHGSSAFNGNLTLNGHLISGNTSGSTTFAANTTNCGTGCTASISGTDTAGVITLNTGTGAAAGAQGTVTFAVAFVSAPRIVVTPNTVPATSTYPQYHVASTTTTFDLLVYTALTDSKTYTFSYLVVQ